MRTISLGSDRSGGGIERLERKVAENAELIHSDKVLLMDRLDAQDEAITAIRVELLGLMGDREQRFEDFLERLLGVSEVFVDSVKELRQEW